MRSGFLVLLFTLVAVEAVAQGTLELHYANGKLSVRAEQVPAKTVWQRAAQLSGIRLHLAAGIDEGPVSWSFNGLPAAEAWRKLAGPNDLAIFYAADPETSLGVRIADLFIFPPSPPAAAGADEPAVAADPGMRDAVLRLGRLVAEPGDLFLRRQAIYELLALDAPEAAQGLESALGAQEPELRREVVQALGEVYGDAPPIALGQVLIGDKDPQLRQDAIRALADLKSEAARLFIEQATKDPDANVRHAARQALDSFRRP